MVNEQVPSNLLNFIRKSKVRGLNATYIYRLLVDAGWPEPQVSAGIQELVSEKTTFAVDQRVVEFVFGCISRGMNSAKILDLLVSEGWAVEAIKTVLQNYSASDYKPLLEAYEKKHFLSKYHKHFFDRPQKKEHKSSLISRAKSAIEEQVVEEEPKEAVVEEKPKDDAELQRTLAKQNEFLMEQISRLSDEFSKREEALLERERKAQEELLEKQASRPQPIQIVKDIDKYAADDEEDAAVSSKAANPKKRPARPKVEPQVVVVQERVVHDGGPTTASAAAPAAASGPAGQSSQNSQAPPVVVMQENQKSLEDLEKKFSDLLTKRNDELLYTNPIIPDRIQLTESPTEDRVQTGIRGFDSVIQGGLRPYTTSLIAGGPGTGKSTLCLQYLVNGALNYNEPGVYITFGESRESIHMLGAQFGWDLDALFAQRKLVVKEYTPEQIDKVIEVGGGSVRDLIDAIGAKRVVIDSITAFLLMYEGQTSQRRNTVELFRALQKWGCTTLAIAEAQGGSTSHKADVLEYEAAAVIFLYNERKGDLRQRSLEVFKMRGTKHAGRIFPMKIVSSGVEVYPRETF